jgi:hypothetical protein
MRLDRLYDVRWSEVRHIAFAWLNALQDKHTPRDQVIATAINFLLICKRFGLEPRRVLEVADRVIRHARDTKSRYIEAIELYMRNELDGH